MTSTQERADAADAQFEAHCTPPVTPLRGVRVALVLDLFDVLRAHGYRRPECARGLIESLRALNALVQAFEDGR